MEGKDWPVPHKTSRKDRQRQLSPHRAMTLASRNPVPLWYNPYLRVSALCCPLISHPSELGLCAGPYGPCQGPAHPVDACPSWVTSAPASVPFGLPAPLPSAAVGGMQCAPPHQETQNIRGQPVILYCCFSFHPCLLTLRRRFALAGTHFFPISSSSILKI